MGFQGNFFGGKPHDKKQGRVTHETPEQRSNSAVTMEVDPVCGMEVDQQSAPAKSEYRSKTYYFCAPGCRKTFEANPDKYTEGGGKRLSGHHGGGGCC